ncbi:hypothetical protein TEK04_19860 [Klenkia sp. LSe6-5]|uniref:Uncharacterized protein n=1 Tax=Klenkia sesuvii TaxID=3103137 RepID=A0ABU8DYS5_9ACTN
MRREFTAAQVRYLLEGKATAFAVGTIRWTSINGSWRGDVECHAVNMPGCSVTLQINVRPKRPDQPTVVLLLNGLSCRRVDVNGGHRGRSWTHVQGRDNSDLEDHLLADPPEWFPTLPIGLPVGSDAYHEVLIAAARLFEIDTAGLHWEDPPEEAP